MKVYIMKVEICTYNRVIVQLTLTLTYKPVSMYVLDAVRLSGISKGKKKLGVTFNFDKQDVIDFTKFSKMTMCRASEANS